MSTVPYVTLNNGIRMPQLGFGVWQIPDDQAATAVGQALEAGYRSIDTAAAYQNEKGTGRALAASGLPREELFVTTKLWNTDQGHDSALRAFDRSLEKLALEYVDLYLIHWPTPQYDTYADSWKALTRIAQEGRAKAIGVSNFKRAHIERITAETGVVPAVNQIELHPHFPQAEARAFHAGQGIATEAWSPLGSGKGLLDSPELAKIGAQYDKTPAQVVLRWHLQLGNVVIPKSVTPARIRENIEIFDFVLSEEDMARIAALDNGVRIGPDPDDFNLR
ncbi:aldo/keto reductase [Streptomyces aidingensis]|uniref:Aldo/keto reductase n=1 Tax=Streptomyces aidingensis TaxID=910347 RepID=A0A1I1J3Y1_9ACTN|nr:aldo/keto reductase [Streptomyces aidingensis]SFC42821.1 Aldo/keto reductase [Streptomyces aidingensis]